MTTLELTLTTLAATLWLLGGHATYMGAVLANQSERAMLTRFAHVCVLLTWPALMLWAVLAPSKKKASG